MSASPWLTPVLAAERAQCHPSTIYAALTSGELYGRQRTAPKGRWRIHEHDLDAWVAGEPPRQLRTA